MKRWDWCTICLYLSVAAWAIFLTALLYTSASAEKAEGSYTPPVESPSEALETAFTDRLPGDDVPAKTYAAIPEDAVWMTVTATAYCPGECCCGEWADGITATGTRAEEGRTVAVDPEVIELGSTVIIDGAQYIAEDIGGAIKGNRIDVFHEYHSDAVIFGVQEIEVIVIK